MDAIIVQGDDIVVKPFDVGKNAALDNDRFENRKPAAQTPKERVAAILQRCTNSIVEDWLGRVKQSKELNRVTLTDIERTGYLPSLIEDLIIRLKARNIPKAAWEFVYSAAAVAHGTVLATKVSRRDGVFAQRAVELGEAVHHLYRVMSHSFNCRRFSLACPKTKVLVDRSNHENRSK